MDKISIFRKLTNIIKTTKTKIICFPKKMGLKKDVFQRQNNTTAQQIISKGAQTMDKKNDNLKLNPHPSFVTTKEDVRSATVRKFEFYPEDLEKMKTMTPKEVLDFQAQLVREGRRYYID